MKKVLFLGLFLIGVLFFANQVKADLVHGYCVYYDGGGAKSPCYSVDLNSIDALDCADANAWHSNLFGCYGKENDSDCVPIDGKTSKYLSILTNECNYANEHLNSDNNLLEILQEASKKLVIERMKKALKEEIPGTCCVPKAKGVGNCSTAVISDKVDLNTVVQSSLSSRNLNQYLTCGSSKNYPAGDPRYTGSYEFWGESCSSVKEVIPPEEYVASYQLYTENMSLGVKFVLSSRCGAKAVTKYCICKNDMSSCSATGGGGLVLKSECEKNKGSDEKCVEIKAGEECSSLLLEKKEDVVVDTRIILPSGISDLNQLGDSSKLATLIGKGIGVLMGLMGSIFLLMMVYGGVIWMIGSTTVGGGATKKDVTKAKGIIVWATLGIIVILSSYAIVDFIFNIF